MSRTLVAHEQPVAKIFGEDYVFTIPSYQRPYSWTTAQAGELIDDLLDFMRGNTGDVSETPPYFLGSVVLIKKEAVPAAIVVDGQQRLTTLTLLLSVIRATATNSEARNGISSLIYEQGNIIRGTENQYRLTLRERDCSFFRDYVQHDGGVEKLKDLNEKLSDSRHNLRENAKLFLKRLDGMQQEERLRLAQFIATRCYIVTVSTPDLDSAYRIFNVLNSRGLDLSATDILKARIIGGIADSRRDIYTKKWEDTEEVLGRETFGELFSHIRMVYRKAKPQGTLLKEFEGHVTYESSVTFIDNILAPMALAYQEISDAAYSSTQNAERVNVILHWLNRIEFKDWLPPALVFIVRHRNNSDLMLKFFIDMDRLVYALLVIRAGINERIDRFSKLTGAIEQGADLWLNDSPLQLSPDMQWEVYSILDGPIYETHSARARSIILLRLDFLVSGGGASYDYDTITVEHVLPQTVRTDTDWAHWFPDSKMRSFWVHRLGNLVLLTRRKNSSASNYDFVRKKTAYFIRGGVSPFALTTQVLQHDAWTEHIVKARHASLLAILEKHWRLEGRKDSFEALLQDL